MPEVIRCQPPARLARAFVIFAVFAAALPDMAVSAPSGMTAFPLSETELTLRAEATSRRFIAAHGQRGMLTGYAAEGLEGWIYPFRIFHDLRVSFRLEGESQNVSGSAVIREIIVNPESVTRIYSAQNYTVRETLFVPLDQPGLLILYDVESRVPLRVVLTFRPDLDLMWPGGIGGQSAEWDARHQAFVLQESSNKYSALAGSPATVSHSAPASYTEPWNADRCLSLELEVSPRAGQIQLAPFVVTCTIPNHYDGGKTYEALLEKGPELYADSAEHYRKLLAGGLKVKTPDVVVNQAFAWAQIALDQAWVCNPWLGCGLVAGYGPSRDTRRPQYAWFFGGDALINAWALEAANSHDRACEAIRFIQKYQKRETGEVFHELSQSADLIDWFKDYPYGYRHTDVSALYLVAMENLYLASSDLDFIRLSWDSLRAAYAYLVSRIDPADGLVTIPPGGWGGDETIGEQVSKDIYLESIWVAGARAFSRLARLLGDPKLSNDAMFRANRALASIDGKLWNFQRQSYNYGYNARGELLTQELGQPNWGIWLGVLSGGNAERVLDRMGSADWVADWGLRSIPSTDSLYVGDSYGHGSVWPLGTGIQSLALYRYHRPMQAYLHWKSLIDQTFLNSLGHVTEALSGEFYRELDVSVPEQIWSSGMVVTSLVRGMLGVEPDAPAAGLTWTPHLPVMWPEITIENLRIGRSNLNLRLQQSETGLRLTVENRGVPVQLDFILKSRSGRGT